MLECLLCGQQLKYCGNTSGMKTHLSYNHAAALAELLSADGAADNQQAKIEPEKVATWPPSKTNMLHRKIAFWVAKRSRPFTICEDKELRDALKFATSGAYTAPDHKTIREVKNTMCSVIYALFTRMMS